MPVGNVSYYHRRKYSPQAPPDHQPRIFLGAHGGGATSERSRSNGNIAVSVNSSSVASLADAANANLSSVSKGVEIESSSVPKRIDSPDGGGAGTTTGSNCSSVRASTVDDGCGTVVGAQQVLTGQACVSESAIGYELQRGIAASSVGCSSGCNISGSVNSANISGNGQQLRVQSSSVGSSGGSNSSISSNKDLTNGLLLLSPGVVTAGATTSTTIRTGPLQSAKSSSLAVVGLSSASTLPSSDSAVPGT
uniref:Uncharacterized protein n=1 Tax=Anopheles funestus TaxID=62324 RepID=A0A4Y0BH51_ANOFN